MLIKHAKHKQSQVYDKDLQLYIYETHTFTGIVKIHKITDTC